MSGTVTHGSPGFSLIELVVVMLITGILAGLTTSLISKPLEGYRDTALRATLVDLAESVTARLARDTRRALPNTIRIAGAGTVLELLHALDGGRYRAAGGTNPGPPSVVDHSAASDWLSFSGDTQFNALGNLNGDNFTYGTPLPAGTRVSIYPVTTTIYTDAENSTNPGLITPAATTVTITDDTDEDQLTLSASHQFLLESPQKRFYLVDTPVTYRCDLGANTLTRYWGYSIVGTQPTNPALAPLNAGSSALVANDVTACAFTYQAGTSQRAGLMTISLTVAQGGEQVRLLRQVHVENVP